jgi:Holliday junction resolvase RusA-like endonuclease
VTLPGWPGSTNHRYRLGVDGSGRARMFLTDDAKAWALVADNAVKRAAEDQGIRVARRTPLSASIELRMPLNRLNILDIDGVVKPVLDAVCRALGINDAWVRELYVQKREGDYGVTVRLRAGNTPIAWDAAMGRWHARNSAEAFEAVGVEVE